MIKCEVVEKFTLKDFEELKNIKRKNADTKGTLYVGDEFECSKEMANYLTGNNPLSKVVVKIVEVEPEKELKQKNELLEDPYKDFVVEEKPKKESKKKTSKKSKK